MILMTYKVIVKESKVNEIDIDKLKADPVNL